MASKSELTVYLVYLLIVLYALCYQVQSPLEPFLVERLIGKGSDASVAYGRLQSFFMFLQAFGSLMIGYFLDRVGFRLGFVVNFLACALTYFILSETDSLFLLYLSKVPGVAMAGYLCGQAALSHLTPPGPVRIVALGRLTTAYTIGGVIGPSMGGWLGSEGNYFLSARLAMAGCFAAAALCCLLPNVENEKLVKCSAADELDKNIQATSWMKRAKMVMQLVGFLIFVKLVTSVAISMASSTQSLILKNELGFTEKDLGFYMSSQFAFGGFANGVLLGPLTKLLGGKPRNVVGNCVPILMGGFLVQTILGFQSVLSQVCRQYAFIGVSMFMSMFQHSMATSITAESTQIVSDDMKGTLIGIEHCIFSVARVFTPTLGVGMLTSYGIGPLYAVSTSIIFAVFVVWKVFSEVFLPPDHAGKMN